MPGKKKKVTKLEDLLVEEVSVVDRPANQRRFLMVKSDADKGSEIQVGENGELSTTDATPPTTDATPPTAEISEVFKAAGSNFAKLEKRLTMDPDVRRELFRSLGDSMGRLNSVLNSADFAQMDRDGSKGESTLVPILAAELDEVAKSIAAMSKQLNKTKAKKSADPVSDPSALEALVSSVEEQVQKRGAKMSKSRLAAFKSAMNTLSEILGELGVEKADISKAAHSHTFKVGGQTVTTDAVNAADGKAHTHKVTANFKKLVTASSPGGSGHAHTITVDGKAVKGSGPTVPKEKPKGNPFAKSEDEPSADEPSEEMANLAKMVEGLTSAVESQNATIKKQAKSLRELRQARPGSNAIPVESGAGDAPSGSRVLWPMDMNK